MAIFHSYMIWSSSKKFASTLKRRKKFKKKIWNFSILGQIQAGSGSGILKTGSGAKFSGSVTLEISIYAHDYKCFNEVYVYGGGGSDTAPPRPAPVSIKFFRYLISDYRYSVGPWITYYITATFLLSLTNSICKKILI